MRTYADVAPGGYVLDALLSTLTHGLATMTLFGLMFAFYHGVEYGYLDGRLFFSSSLIAFASGCGVRGFLVLLHYVDAPSGPSSVAPTSITA
eukprot:3071941-Pleurochrysis_carterae.AAC.1